MQFQLAFRYLLDRPGGFINLLMVMACQCIPIVGPVVLLGYSARVAVALNRDPELMRHPKFDFNQFTEYLKRGIWPFLIGLLVNLLVLPVIIIALVIGLILDPPDQFHPPILAFVLCGLATFFSSIFVLLLATPMMFHAEFTGRFDLKDGFRFACSYWTKVCLVTIGTGLAFWFLSTIVALLGLLLCCVGIYPAIALIHMANQHLLVQLYRLYLDRGGEPLEEYSSPKRRDRDDEWEDEEDDEAQRGDDDDDRSRDDDDHRRRERD